MNRFDEMSKEAQERMLRIGRKAQTKSLPFVKWTKDNTFEINDRSVLHSQWIALADQATAGWVRWNSNFTKVEEKTHTVCIFDHEEPPRPTTPDGSKDPWRFQLELPLQQIETSELALFTSNTEWARQAIGAVIEYFAKTHRRPIVQLEARETIKDGRTVIVGALDIVAPDESDDFVIDLTRSGVPAAGNGAAAPGSKHNDMNDNIPF